jgi:hypothetical protein
MPHMWALHCKASSPKAALISMMLARSKDLCCSGDHIWAAATVEVAAPVR